MSRLLSTLAIVALAALAALAPVASLRAQTGPAAPPEFPDTPVGRIGRELIALVNRGDSAAIRSFFAEHGLPEMDRGRTAVWYAHTLAKLHVQSGGLVVDGIMAPPSGRVVRVMTRARRGGRWLGMHIEMSAAQPDRMESVLTIALDDPTKPPPPWPAGLATDADVADAIRARVRELVAADRFSGVVLVGKGDSILVHEAVGMADRERGIPNSFETRFGTTSVGKMFTGVAIAQLVEQGKLHFDDTLAKVLPDYPNREAARRITIRELLTHTAGVPDVFTSARFNAHGPFRSHAEMLPTFADGVHGEPGARFEYSNGGFAVLGAIIEKLSGQSYEDYLRDHVWGPAGMRYTEHAGEWRGAGRAVPYARFSDTDPLGVEPRRPAGGSTAPASTPPMLAAFGGGSYAAVDLYRFTRALRTGKLLRPEMADLVMRGAVSMGGGPAKYGFGFFDVDRDGHRTVGHSGSNPDTGLDADVEMLPENDYTVVVLANYDAPAGIRLSSEIQQLVAGRK